MSSRCLCRRWTATHGDGQLGVVAEIEVAQSVHPLALLIVRYTKDRADVDCRGGLQSDRRDAQLGRKRSRDRIDLGEDMELGVMGVLRLLERHDCQSEPFARRSALRAGDGLRRVCQTAWQPWASATR